MIRKYIEKDGHWAEVKRTFKKQVHEITMDIAPYKSMIDGSIIGSRSAHRIHLRDHNCQEIGNETDKMFEPQPIDKKWDTSRKEEIVRQFTKMSEEDCSKMIKQDITNARGY